MTNVRRKGGGTQRPPPRPAINLMPGWYHTIRTARISIPNPRALQLSISMRFPILLPFSSCHRNWPKGRRKKESHVFGFRSKSEKDKEGKRQVESSIFWFLFTRKKKWIFKFVRIRASISQPFKKSGHDGPSICKGVSLLCEGASVFAQFTLWSGYLGFFPFPPVKILI